jgi:Bifunctional DNA primase/polymerase, N-terminal
MSAPPDGLSPFGRAALAYATRWHLFVLPLIVAGKVPHGRSVPRGHLDASSDPRVVGVWWQRAPNANIGIACAPSGLLVLDIDPRNGGDETFGELLRVMGPLPATWTTLTPGGGQHYYFRFDGEVKRATLGEGVDVKHHGYVVAPPSVHPNGGRYRWDAGAHPTESAIASLPFEWRARVAAYARNVPLRKQSSGLDARRSFLGVAFASLGWLGPVLEDGRRLARCPWAEQHSDGRGLGRDSSAVLFSPVAGVLVGGFHCSHGHCAGRGTVHVLRTLADQFPRALDAGALAYPKAYRSVVRQLAKRIPRAV